MKKVQPYPRRIKTHNLEVEKYFSLQNMYTYANIINYIQIQWLGYTSSSTKLKNL